MPNVYYAVCPGTGGTSDKKTGSPTITISGGVATLSVAQTGNIGQGFRITYDTSKVCFISKVNSSTSFDVVTATGGTPSNEASAVVVNSIAADYASLSAAEAGASDANHLNTSDLVTATTILNLVCYAGASADTAAVTIDGYTTDTTRFISIFTPQGGTESINNQRHSGKLDTNKYILTAGNRLGNTHTLGGYVHITGVQFRYTSVFSGSNPLVAVSASANILCDKCIIVGGVSGSGHTDITIGTVGNSVTCTITNSILDQGTADDMAVVYGHNRTGCNFYLYNCTLTNGYRGVDVYDSGETSLVTLRNCVIFNFSNNDLISLFNAQYCATDDGDTGTGMVTLATWSDVFTDYANGDFSLKNYTGSGALIGAGTDLSAYFTTDIIGTTRSTWDIGAFEYGSGPKWNTITPAKWDGINWGNLKWNGM